MFSSLIQKVYADTTLSGTAIGTEKLVNNILSNIVNPVITLMIALAVLYFVWGAFQFVQNADSSEERKKGGMNMLWGIIGLFIMLSAWGILDLILGTIGK